ncbi:hypothetical protein [Oceanimonas smirnovii]|uniref:hypothetical protein n=1 Tax=Oceanimonas smirnovii TaxID=264574 RepID=UPI003FD139D9
MDKSHTEYCYSWNGEDFKSDTFSSVKAAMADAAVENDGEHGVVYIGKVSRPDNSMFFPDAGDVIEHMAEQADDFAGEYASDYPDVSDEAKAELAERLETLLNAWCEKHGVSPAFYQVRDVKERSLPTTAE